MAGTATRTRKIRHRIGLIVNPIAGMGGPVALKGTDGDLAARAAELGAVPLANDRAKAALMAIAPVAPSIDWLTVAGAMGEDALADAGLAGEVVCRPRGDTTNATDTRQAATAMRERGVDLILFAGGDGTATDIFDAVGSGIPILGIPAGVKMHSAVFALSPRAAGEAVRTLSEAHTASLPVEEAEIMDRPGDEASPELLGYATTPSIPQFVAHGKSAGSAGSVEGACRQALERIAETPGLVLIGAGTTMRQLKQALGFDGTLLGVDAVRDGRLVRADLSAADIIELLDDETGATPPLLVVGVVGGQGFLFGRGNQQLSAEVLERIGRDRIVVVSSMEKIVALPRRQLWVDTGNERVDAALAGYLPVYVGDRHIAQLRVRAASGVEAAPAVSPPPAVQNG